MYEYLTQYLDALDVADGMSRGHLISLVNDFIIDMVSFRDNHPELGFDHIDEILSAHGIEVADEAFDDTTVFPLERFDVSQAEGQIVVLALYKVCRSWWSRDDLIYEFGKGTALRKWLARLVELDAEAS